MGNRLTNWLNNNRPLAGVMILAIFLVFFKIESRAFWMDETFVLGFFKSSLVGFVVDYFRHPDNHPPLYYFLVLIASKIFPWTEAAVRLVSALAGVGSVYVLYLLVLRAVQDKKIALVSALFASLSAYFVLISQMARYHSLAGFASLVTLYFFYQLFVEGYTRRAFVGYLIALIVTGYIDYPHVIYLGLITNGLFIYQLIRRTNLVTLKQWVLGQVVTAVVCSPLAWLLYHRIAIQGDGGFTNTNLLANSWKHIVAGISFHVYTFFFSENILPWNIATFVIGCAVLFLVGVGLVQAWRDKKIGQGSGLLIFLGGALIVVNTLFMNVANPRYNFIVYPKFGFVAYFFWVFIFAFGLSSLRSKKIALAGFVLWTIVAVFGLTNFYASRNYLNASYFNSFQGLEFVKKGSLAGDYLAITPDAGEGLYEFYKQEYFPRVTPIFWAQFQSSTVPVGSRVWFFATGSDGTEVSVSTDAIIPAGYAVVDRFDSTPIDLTLKAYKEKILGRPSYLYKNSVFLLKKI
jgi:4-amino-4-deoxy-L-arabinose transferase-like glycosyltransferase